MPGPIINGELIISLVFYEIIEATLALSTVYLTYVFTGKKDLTGPAKLLILALLAPVFLFAHTNLSVSGFNISDCDAYGF